MRPAASVLLVAWGRIPCMGMDWWALGSRRRWAVLDSDAAKYSAAVAAAIWGSDKCRMAGLRSSSSVTVSAAVRSVVFG